MKRMKGGLGTNKSGGLVKDTGKSNCRDNSRGNNNGSDKNNRYNKNCGGRSGMWVGGSCGLG